jgi:putative DNA primase/helicase
MGMQPMPEVEINPEAIPEELRDRDQWLMWDASAEAPRRPHWRGNFAVSWTEPDDWHSFEEALEAAEEHASWGIGYVFANTNRDHPRGLYGALDLDGCVDDEGSPKEWLPSLQPFFDADAYMELSPSGTGIHIPLLGFEPPEWWSDTHFTDDEHEGLEAYGKKFFTFTGDRLRGAGEAVAETGEFVEDWLIEAHKSVTGDDPTKEQSDDFDHAVEGGRANREEFLEEDDIRDALDHIDPDVGYNTWRDIGFALAEFFSSDRTAYKVFRDWSRGGSKWDDDAEKQAKRIIEDASSGGGRTIGTVIHHARSGGWEMPTTNSPDPVGIERPDGEAEGEESTENPDDDSETSSSRSGPRPSWKDVRSNYGLEDDGKKYGRLSATNALESLKSWMYVVESETLWVYDDDRGYFNRWGEQFAAKILEQNLSEHYSRTEKEEIVGRLEARNQTHREELNARSRDGHYLCVGNGVVDLATGNLQDHSPTFKFTRGLEWDYEPAKADPEPVLEFLDDVTKREEDRDTLLDHLAHGLMPGHPYRAFIITYGPGSNGKTQMGQLFRGFVGEDNAASVELQDLTGDDDFATGGLPGAFVNIGDDISVSEIRDVSILKSVTGGGTVRANEKYEKKYQFQNEAAMFFSANEPPRIAEESEAIGDRLYPIEMPYRFVDDNTFDPDNSRHKKKTPGISKQLLEDREAMRGLLLLCVKHAQSLIESDGQYSMPEGPKERRDMYEAASDPIRRFALDYLETGGGDDLILKEDAFAVYREMCEADDERVASQDGFKRQIAQQALIDVESTRTRNMTPGDNREMCWRYVRFADDARDLMPARLIERYFDAGSAAEDDDDGDGGDDDSATARSNPWNASPVAEVADDPTGYATVSVQVLDVTHAESENQPSWRATVKDETSAVDVVSWEEPDAPDEGDYIVIKNAELDEYDGSTQLVVRPNVTETVDIQPGVGYTEGAEPDSGQSSISDSTAADGGQAKSEVEERNEEAAEKSDGTNVREKCQRLAEEIVGDATLKQIEIQNMAADRYQWDLSTTKQLIEKARDLGYLEQIGDNEYRSV